MNRRELLRLASACVVPALVPTIAARVAIGQPLPTTAPGIAPYSPEWLAMNIAEGAVQGLGAQVFASFLGGSTVDYVALEMDLLKRIGLLINRAIADDAKRQLESRLLSFQVLYRQYSNQQDYSKVQSLIERGSDIVTAAKSLGLPAIGIFYVSAAMELALYQEIYKHTNSVGDRKTLAEYVKDLVDWADRVNVESSTITRARFSDVYALDCYPSCELSDASLHYTGPPIQFWYYKKDDVQMGKDHNRETVLNQRNRDMTEEYMSLYNKTVKPFIPTFDAFLKMRDCGDMSHLTFGDIFGNSLTHGDTDPGPTLPARCFQK